MLRPWPSLRPARERLESWPGRGRAPVPRLAVPALLSLLGRVVWRSPASAAWRSPRRGAARPAISARPVATFVMSAEAGAAAAGPASGPWPPPRGSVVTGPERLDLLPARPRSLVALVGQGLGRTVLAAAVGAPRPPVTGAALSARRKATAAGRSQAPASSQMDDGEKNSRHGHRPVPQGCRPANSGGGSRSTVCARPGLFRGGSLAVAPPWLPHLFTSC